MQDVADDFYGTTYDKIQIKKTPDTVSRFVYRGRDGVKNAAGSQTNQDVTVDFYDGEKPWNTFYDESVIKEDKKDKYEYFLGGNSARIHIATNAGTGKTLLLLKDSYSNSMVEFLAKDYDHIYMFDLRYMEDEYHTFREEIEKEHPVTDVLVVYNTEKFMKDDYLWQLES